MTPTWDIDAAVKFVHAHPPAIAEAWYTLNAVFVRILVVDEHGYAAPEWYSCHSMQEVKAVLGF